MRADLRATGSGDPEMAVYRRQSAGVNGTERLRGARPPPLPWRVLPGCPGYLRSLKVVHHSDDGAPLRRVLGIK
jgi:hypothetical protein